MSSSGDILDDDDDRSERRSQILRIAIPVVVFTSVIALAVHFMSGATGVRREAPRLQTILATLPPPPPPPPPKVEQKVEPDKKVDVPKPDDTPKPVDAPKPMTINGPAQAGGDAFNIGAGSGGGSVVTPGGGFGDATYSRYMGSELQQRIQEDDRVNRLVFSADVSVWIDSNGRVTQVRILRSSGDAKTDDALVAALQGMPALDAPPASLQFPQKVAIRGRRM